MQVTSLCPLLQVYDMPQSERFYCDLLGFEIVSSSQEIEAPEGRHFQWALLRLGPANLMLNTAYDVGERPSAPDQTRQAAHADTELYLSCEDVGSIYQELLGRGLSLDAPAATPYGMTQLRVRDPDGYSLCFQQQS